MGYIEALLSQLDVDTGWYSDASLDDVERACAASRKLEALGEAAFPVLADVIRNPQRPDNTRMNVAYILARIGTPEALDVLVSLQRSGTVGYSTEVLEQMGSLAVDALVRGLQRDQGRSIVAVRSMWLLSRMSLGTPAALRDLVHLQEHSPYPEIRDLARPALQGLQSRVGHKWEEFQFHPGDQVALLADHARYGLKAGAVGTIRELCCSPAGLVYEVVFRTPDQTITAFLFIAEVGPAAPSGVSYTGS